MPSFPKLCISWSIKGYHVFQRKPHVAIDLDVYLEENNPVDPMAMKVVMTSLSKIPEELHNATTRPAKAKRSLQTVTDIAGLQVGRAPANLCTLFRALLKRGYIKENKIKCSYTCLTTPTAAPPSSQSFRKGRKGQKGRQDRQGGGVEMECDYYSQIEKNEYLPQVQTLWERFIPRKDRDIRPLRFSS